MTFSICKSEFKEQQQRYSVHIYYLVISIQCFAYPMERTMKSEQSCPKQILQTTTCNEGYIYSNEYFDETLSTKLNLVCDRKYLKTLLDTILIIGLLFGSLMGGAIGDKIGRKKACFGAIMTIVPVTICKL